MKYIQEIASSAVKNFFSSIWKVVNTRNYATDMSQTLISSIIRNKNPPKKHLLLPEQIYDRSEKSQSPWSRLGDNIKNRYRNLSTR